MLALVAALGALYALALAVEPLRDFFELTQLGGGQLFLALLSAAGGLVLASAIWRLPAIERLDEPVQAPRRRARRRAVPTEVPRPARGGALMAAAVIFDIDGTLVDTNYQHAIAWFRAFRQHEVTVPVWRIHRAIGMGGDQLVAALAGDDVESEKGDEIRAAEGPLYMGMIEEVEAFEGASELLAELSEGGHAVVLSSSAKSQEVEHYLDLLSAREIVTAGLPQTTSSETKPEPDLVEVALREVRRR